MIISLDWLGDYVRPDASADAIAERLALSGLNHESTQAVGVDTAIEIEVTSNRSDCLGHIGVAREVAAIFGASLNVPVPKPNATRRIEGSVGPIVPDIAVAIESSEMCSCYQARVIRGVRIGPSPSWLVDRLATVGVASVNNVVDITNDVMLESGQPLHAFDLDRIRGGRILVRSAREGERFEAINHRSYVLDRRMCVIADAERPVALAGVMGGADSEISDASTRVLLESAQFAPLAVRAAARGLSLASPSSYRFERRPDPAMVEWAGRRATALILELAGGSLEGGVAEAGHLVLPEVVVRLRPGRVAEVLGIDVPEHRQEAILSSLGFGHPSGGDKQLWLVPTWRRDVTREIDLIEEIGRIEGYERVPETVPLTPRPVDTGSRDLAVRCVGEVLVAAGLCEAMTRSVVDDALDASVDCWSAGPSLRIDPPLVRGADRLRRSLLPSLLESRAVNAAVGSPHGDLFEVARIYLPDRTTGGLPVEPLVVGFVVSGDYGNAKGLVEAMLRRLGFDGSGFGASNQAVRYRPIVTSLFSEGRAAEVVLGSIPPGSDPRIGVVGEIAPHVLRALGVEGPVSGAEVLVDRLDQRVGRIASIELSSDFPAVERDLNLVVDESVPWAIVAEAIAAAAGGVLEQLTLGQVWVDAERLGAGRKSFLVTLRLRSHEGTMTTEQTRAITDACVSACASRCGAVLRGS
ncbi:MAG: phenylalanine--tRNA ligase subunit beta [Planctomycetaceae bacterium]